MARNNAAIRVLRAVSVFFVGAASASAVASIGEPVAATYERGGSATYGSSPVPFVFVDGQSSQPNFDPNDLYAEKSSASWNGSARVFYQVGVTGTAGDFIPLIAKIRFQFELGIRPDTYSSFPGGGEYVLLAGNLDIDDQLGSISPDVDPAAFIALHQRFSTEGGLFPHGPFMYEGPHYSYAVAFNVLANNILDVKLEAGGYGFSFADGSTSGLFYLDPFFSIDPTYLAGHPGTSLSFSPGADNRDPAAAGSPGAVPEPGTWAMLLCGFGLTGGMIRLGRLKVSFAR